MEKRSIPHSPLPRVVELILSGTDINAVNHTTISLWHFRQLALEMVPPMEPLEPEEDKRLETPETVFEPIASRGIELGEGMSLAAVQYEQEGNLPRFENSSSDAKPIKDNSKPTERSLLHLQDMTHIPGKLTLNTHVAVLFKRYRCVLCLDASPSIISIDPSSGRLFLDLLYESVELFVWSLLRPMEVGGIAFMPEIHMSVLVQGALVESLCVLMQGYIITPSNAAGFLQLIKKRFQLIENDWASQAQERGQWGYLGNAVPASLEWILQNVVFALNSLPTDCTPLIVLVTDGVVNVRDVYSYDNLLMQLVRHDIQCHFLRIGGGDEDELNATFGFVPDTKLLRFVSEYTGGSVFDKDIVFEACHGPSSGCSNRVKKMTNLQDLCFLRKSSVHASSAPVVKLDDMDSTCYDKKAKLPLRPYRMWREKVYEYRIFADVNRIVEARLREGFSINKLYVKSYKRLILNDRFGAESLSNDEAAINGPNNNMIKILIVFLFQWKQNIWLEYVLSTTTDNTANLTVPTSTMPQLGRRVSGQGMKVHDFSSPLAKCSDLFAKDQKNAWSEWHVKMNVLAYADFLRAFEDTMQRSLVDVDHGSTVQDFDGDFSLSSPVFVRNFIRNVQDVDRVLLHLMTATASIKENSDSAANQFFFGTSTSLASTAGSPKITSFHPVFNIIGELTTALWHRWFFVERFEILSIVNSDVFVGVFYRNEVHGAMEHSNTGPHLHTPANLLQRMTQSYNSNIFGTSSGNANIGIESLAEPLVAILDKWSSQKLSQDLFLKFLQPVSANKCSAPPIAKISPSSAKMHGGIAQRRRQRSHVNNSGGYAACAVDGTSTNESNGALCFVRLEFKNKSLCAVNVAFFATNASTRRQVLNDLKHTIYTGINVATGTLLSNKSLPMSSTDSSFIFCHRMLSRLLVTHDTLLLDGLDQELGSFDGHEASLSLEAEKKTEAASSFTNCCGGSELQLQRVFGAYMWHSSWKWEVASLHALLNVMRQLHDARISCGFWILDWKMVEGDDGQNSHVANVIFGREILMEDEKGHTKTALLQYALRRVSDTCLMTSFWMEPQHGSVKRRLSDEVDYNDRLHWKIKQAIGHSTPIDNYKRRTAQQNKTPHASTGFCTYSAKEAEGDLDDVITDGSNDSTYLGESELLHLIRDYLFKSDCHFLSCLYTFDSIINLRDNIDLLNKNAGHVVGSNWIMDRQIAAENGMILPPFSTARLLATSKRSTEHFLMYLQNGNSSTCGENGSVPKVSPAVSTANENLYCMLELTLRGLSDCEVSWTDFNGGTIGEPRRPTNNYNEDDQFFLKGMDGQLPLWLKHHLALSFQECSPNQAYSKGKCFAKLVSDDCVVLAFFPSLDTLQNKSKIIEKEASNDDNNITVLNDDKHDTLSKAFKIDQELRILSQQVPTHEEEEDETKSHIVRMSVSADDIFLYQERRRNFREGYKSWRMGHFQGSRDKKQSYGRDFQRLRLPSTPEDHELCEDISRHTPYGCDFHLLIESGEATMGSGFFQVAFYECSLSRLATNLLDGSVEMFNRVDLPHTILKQLFFSKRTLKSIDDRPDLPLERSGNLKKGLGRPTSEFIDSSNPQIGLENTLASRRFCKKVKRAHEHNFSRGVYMALRGGGSVQHSDLLQALSSCVEVPVDVDITLLYRIMEKAASHKIPILSPAAAAVVSADIGTEIMNDKLYKSIEAILSSFFMRIKGTKYYYFTGNENSIDDNAAANEYDLHILMEDLDDGDADNNAERQRTEEIDDNISLDDGRSTMHLLYTEAEGSSKNWRRHGSVGRESFCPVPTSTEENSGGDQRQTMAEEDAEFNKEVDVATSSFSVPFFFRFECRKLTGSRKIRCNSADTFTLASTDSNMLRENFSIAKYEGLQEDGIDQEQHSSPSSRRKEFDVFLESLLTNQEQHKPFESADIMQIAELYSKVLYGRIALRLVTLTLPNKRASNSGHHMPFDIETSKGIDKENPLSSIRSQSLSTLHLFQRQVLTRVREKIKEWCSVEILSILKSANDITPAIGALVQRLFDELPENVLTEVTYPLEFVSCSQEASVNPHDLLKREFEKGHLLNVHQCNGVYFVVENGTVGDDAQTHPDAGLAIPYWAYFELSVDHIVLRYQHFPRFSTASAEINRLKVLTCLQLGVRAICRRVNQYLLLLQLHETRTCNGLLLPANGDLALSPRSPKQHFQSQTALCGKNEQIKQPNFFWPSQFECNLRYSATFKLHERLAPNVALNTLCTSALEQFQVHNRRHVFVYRDRDGHVFYMKISIVNDTTISCTLRDHSAKDRQERSGIFKSNTEGNSDGYQTNLTTAAASGGVPCIRLEVFGVSEAGEEVTHELCRLLERKLDEGTQVVLMKLLARNIKFQLSLKDLAFLCPPAAEPSSVVDYILPFDEAGCFTLLHYLSQTLRLTPYIRPVTIGESFSSRNLRDSTNTALRGAHRENFVATSNFNNSFNEEASTPLSQFSNGKASFDSDGKINDIKDCVRMHPACFGGYQNKLWKSQNIRLPLFDASTHSPVFFSLRMHEMIIESTAGSSFVSPEILAQASYVMNLNPDLRLSQGFLSRVGKGLAIMRVDITQCSTVEMKENKYKNVRVKRMPDIAGLAKIYSNGIVLDDIDTSKQMVLRCQLWIRGVIQITELNQVVETFLDEALYDFHIEAIIKKRYASSAINGRHADLSCVSTYERKIPSDIDTLISLFKNAWQLPSSSITYLKMSQVIAPWDLQNIVEQIQDFLCCLPSHLRPTLLSKPWLSESYDCVASHRKGMYANPFMCKSQSDKFRLVVKDDDFLNILDDAELSDSDAETTASISSAFHHIEPLTRADSIHSENSEIDSLSGRSTFACMSAGASSDLNANLQESITPSITSTTLSAVGPIRNFSHQPHLLKNANFSERDVLLYPSSGCRVNRRHRKLPSRERWDIKRSMYYVVDLSASEGLRLFGYNMSSAFVEALTTHLARVITWTKLRNNLLRSLLLEKVGISVAAPIGSAVLQPRSFFMALNTTNQAGKGVGKSYVVPCADSTVSFINFQSPVLSILPSNEWFPKSLDASHLRSTDGTALGAYLQEAQTQSALEVVEALYARPRRKSSTYSSDLVPPPRTPDLSREISGSSFGNHHNSGDASPSLLNSQSLERARSGGIVSSNNISDSMSSSPSRRLSGPSPLLPYRSGNRSETTSRVREVAGATTALMAARARARGGSGFSGRKSNGPGSVALQCRKASAATSGASSIAPWDLPLVNTKGPRLHGSVSEAKLKPEASPNFVIPTVLRGPNISSSANTMKNGSKGLLGIATRHARKGSQDLGISELRSSSSSSSLSGLTMNKPSIHRKQKIDATSWDASRVHCTWKKRLECAWGPRSLYPDNSERWVSKSKDRSQVYGLAEERIQRVKYLAPLQFYCAAFTKEWEVFETRSTSNTVSTSLLEKLASLRADREMKEPVAKDVVVHLVNCGHLLLHQRFRAAYVERLVSAKAIDLSETDESGVLSISLRALQSSMDLVHLLSYKREFVFDQNECAVAKLYTEHTVQSMGVTAGADLRVIQRQVAANLSPMRLEVASKFFEEFADHLRTLGFRSLKIITTDSSHLQACSVDPKLASGDSKALDGETFSEYFSIPEKAVAEPGSWTMGADDSAHDSVSIVVLEVKCDNRGLLLSAVLVSSQDLMQQDLRCQQNLAAKSGFKIIGASGARVQGVASWLRAQLQTQALVYNFTIRYFQQHLLQWFEASHDNIDQQKGQSHTVGKLLGDNDALVLSPLLSWKKVSTYQNIVNGLRCFLHAFPDPPEDHDKATRASTFSPTGISLSKQCKATIKSKDKFIIADSKAFEARAGDVNRPTSRALTRFARRITLKKAQQKPPHNQLELDSDPAPLSLILRSCVIRVATMTLQPALLQTDCSDLIVEQILLRYIACHCSRYEVLDLLQFGTPDTIVCHSFSGSFFHRPSKINSTICNRDGKPFIGYSLLITTQPSVFQPLELNSVQLLLLKSTASTKGVGSEVLPVERALQEAKLFTKELFHVAAQHYERDLLWSRLLYDNSHGPACYVARTLAHPDHLFRVEVGPQQLEECLRLSICTPLEVLDPRLHELLRVTGVCWQELALRLKDIYANQLREFQFQEEDESSSHLLLLCPDAFDLIIHLTFITHKSPVLPPKEDEEEVASISDGESINCLSQSGDSYVTSLNEQCSEKDIRVEICRREEPTNKQFTFAQRRSISEFVNSIVHWQWRSLIYD